VAHFPKLDVAALAANTPSVTMNLLSEDERKRGLRSNLRKERMGVIVQSATLLALIAGSYRGAVYSKKTELHRLNSEIPGISSQVGDLRQMEAILENARGRMSRERVTLVPSGPAELGCARIRFLAHARF